MNKKKLSTLTLVLCILGFLGAFSSFSQYSEPSVLAYSFFIVPTLFGVVTWRLRASAKKEAEAAEAAVRRDREEREAKVQAFRERYDHIRFPVAGVTFKNDDGTDRQKILLEASFNQAAETDVWLEEEDETLGENSGIRVLTDYGCVGYIRRSDKQKVRRFTGQPICTKYLSVEQFINDEGKAIYRADVVFVIDRENPAQQWYYDSM